MSANSKHLLVEWRLQHFQHNAELPTSVVGAVVPIQCRLSRTGDNSILLPVPQVWNRDDALKLDRFQSGALRHLKESWNRLCDSVNDRHRRPIPGDHRRHSRWVIRTPGTHTAACSAKLSSRRAASLLCGGTESRAISIRGKFIGETASCHPLSFHRPNRKDRHDTSLRKCPVVTVSPNTLVRAVIERRIGIAELHT
jgi:hypothetical protein